ncbi:unnamed protein product [Caenorhabditis brenneri]
MLPKNLQRASTKRKDPNPSQGTNQENNVPIMQKPRGRKVDPGRSVMQTVEEVPTDQKRNSGGMPPRTQMLPANPNQMNPYPVPPQAHSPYKNNVNNYPKELPAKTMMLPPTPMQQQPPSIGAQRTQMLPVSPMIPIGSSPRPSQGYPQNMNPYHHPNPPQMPQAQQTPRAHSPIRQPVQPIPRPPHPPPPQNQQYPRAPPQNAPQNINASVGAAWPVAQLPAITAPTPLAPPPPPLPQQPSEGVKKSHEKDGPTVDLAEVSEKNRRRENVNNFIRGLLTNGIEGLKKEYRDAPNGGSLESAKVFHNNPTRNRYVNIPCCDATRVKLADDPNYYIHANVVSSAKSRRYICAQAPLNGTIEEFWKMVIFSGLEYIVMLCEFKEQDKQKSAVYFPVKVGSSLKVGKLCTVTKVASENIDKTLTMSTLRITKKDNKDATLTVKHIHWHNWPDHGVPDNFVSPLRLLNVFKGCHKPIVVHCSAGVGRTGTLVLIFIVLESLSLPDFAGVPRLFARLREERFKSIQTEMQYLYVHRCVLEYLIHVKKFNHCKEDYERFVKDYKAMEKSAP